MNWYDIASVAVTLFLIMDPLGNVPVFNAVLSKLDRSRRTKVVARELIIALFVLLGTLFVGDILLAFLGLTQPSLHIAGGVLLFIISLRMIFPSRPDHGDEAMDEEPFIVPLAVPLIAGPSTIAVLLLLSSSQPGRILEWVVALFLAWLGTTILLLGSSKLLDVIGTRGSLALERLMGMILVILATQMLLDGIRDFVATL
ncbi:MAG: YhgN family NAAT transporter [Candidatus Thiodiazotropha endolucinida]|nr:YhgN family NAAT transporter [Candidatus Thiodiazotropha sp. (ex Lucina pensylvanica)]MBT3037324.1 YhgN family NAAT transporter [Candidatus Thiodiazotropha sp. (ex Codakia orbicularis)]MBV2123918.1 YhgN family NAAT transporter [Candidatus Thiodiazotropha taylori]MCG8024759.1 YhgN family NAAT transporter [Candidatus Thiodiazotropha endolucinida]MBT3044307.1 YhgN family NAAT transporter [Candidatus Thiodiazotropha sp. (ex Codakia orbicularis)]